MESFVGTWCLVAGIFCGDPLWVIEAGVLEVAVVIKKRRSNV